MSGKWDKEHPWAKSYYAAKYRTSHANSIYFRKGITCTATVQDFKELWFRDEAWKLKRPSIDRIDSSKGYFKENCRYIELSENVRRALIITHCVRGHEFIPQNVMMYRGHRKCLLCREIVNKKNRKTDRARAALIKMKCLKCNKDSYSHPNQKFCLLCEGRLIRKGVSDG